MSVTRKIVIAVLPALLIAGSASAATFSAESKGQGRRGESCPNGAFLCGVSEIDGLGTADFGFFLDAFAPVDQSCGVYEATITFTLSDASMLVLDEVGRVCGPGRSFFATRSHTYGNPVEGHGDWVVATATGAFSALEGAGTSWFRNAGAIVHMHHVSVD